MMTKKTLKWLPVFLLVGVLAVATTVMAADGGEKDKKEKKSKAKTEQVDTKAQKASEPKTDKKKCSKTCTYGTKNS